MIEGALVGADGLAAAVRAGTRRTAVSAHLPAQLASTRSSSPAASMAEDDAAGVREARPFWDEQAEISCRESERRLLPVPAPMTVAICLERSLAEQLCARSGFSFDDTGKDAALVARREARR